MRISIAWKVTLGLGMIMAAAIAAMLTTYFESAKATQDVQASQALTQAMLTATAEIEVDIVSGGLRMFQYMESGDPYYRQAYQGHTQRFSQGVDRLMALAAEDERQKVQRMLADQFRGLDQLSIEVMDAQDRMLPELQSVYGHWRKLLSASTRLYEGASSGSPRYVLGRKIEAHLAETMMSLVDFPQRDRGDDTINGQISAIRALNETHAQLALSAADKAAFGEFERTFESFSTALLQVQQTSQSKRASMVKTLYLQRQIISAIAAQIKPALNRHAETAARNAAMRMRRVLFVAGAMSLLLLAVALLAGRYARRTIVAPIRQLAAGADAITSGDLNHRVTLTTGDEYADLARHINHMLDELQSTTVSRSLHQEQETQLRALLDGVRDYAIFSVDGRGRVNKWNVASTRILGYATEDMQGVSFARIFKDKEQARIARDEVLKAIAANARFETNSSLVRKSGETFDANIVVTPLNATDGAFAGYSVVVRDITERLKAERRIEKLATRDALTGLYNRTVLMEQMHAAIARATRLTTHLAVMFVDLDHFKTVNDTLGHAAGDELLCQCAKRLMDCVREGDLVARPGGDEFVVLLADVTDTAIISHIADRMLKMLTTPYHLSEHDAQISASIGICLYPADGRDVATLMKNADIAMYHAKALNRNNYQYFAEEMNQRMLLNAQLERELRSALENNEFLLHYQPQIKVSTGEIQGVESLVRWQHPVRGLLSPAHFIPAAEASGLIVPIGDWVLNHACSTIKAWRDKGVEIPYIVVNVSAAQLRDQLVTSVRQALVTHGIEASWLMLEITETMLMERVEEAISILRRIRELGIRIAMDDFGTGYSSLSVLQRLPLDTLKIDRSFVGAIDDETDNARAVAIIGAIIAIAKELNLSVVAEGVESPTQLAFLRTLECDTWQGYLYSLPVDTMSLESRFIAPVKSVLEDASGHAISMITKVTMELPVDARKP